MDDFLLSITLGEYVAAGNARAFAHYFRASGLSDLETAYKEIANDELRHFEMLKRVIRKNGKVPTSIKKIYKGSLLSIAPNLSVDSIFERMCVMHTVFEGAAFAYMSLLSKIPDNNDRSNSLQPLSVVAKEIMIDEARHMSDGFKALDYMKQKVVSIQDIKASKERVLVNAKSLRSLPSLTVKGNDEFVARLYDLYDSNIEKNIRRVFK